MSYEAEKIAATLKAAREKKGLSQRELSARAGVPQSHISKIETGGVNLRISSLAAIANALDLEIALVPRKAVPAVNSIVRSVDDVPKASPETRKALNSLENTIEKLSRSRVETDIFDKLERQFRELKQVQNLLQEPESLRRIRETLKAFDRAGGSEAVRLAEEQMKALRNSLAHSGAVETAERLIRPAYRLDGDDNG